MTFHDLLLVSNETTNLACFTVNTILFVCFFTFFLVLFLFVRMSYGERVSFSLFLSSDDSFSSPIPFFNVIVCKVMEGADQLHKNEARDRKLSKVPLMRKLWKCSWILWVRQKLKMIMQFVLTLMKIPWIHMVYMFCWIYFMLGYIKLKCSLMKCPHSYPAYEWQQVLKQDIGTS